MFRQCLTHQLFHYVPSSLRICGFIERLKAIPKRNLQIVVDFIGPT